MTNTFFKYLLAEQIYERVAYLALVISLLGFPLAILTFQEYHFFTDTLSQLATQQTPRFFFDIAVICAGLAGFIITNNIITIFQSNSTALNKVIFPFQLLRALTMIHIICSFGVVLFPTGPGLIGTIHDTFAVILFITLAIFTGIITRISYKYALIPPEVAVLGLLIVSSVLLQGIVGIFSDFTAFFQKTTVYLFFIFLPVFYTQIKQLNH